jgi:ABC-type glycerol-3-phosphate transport system permease component
LFPHHPSLDNYSSIVKNGDFTTALRTSLIDAGAATLIALTVGSFCAYALARLRFPLKFLLLAVVLSISTFPPIAIAFFTGSSQFQIPIGTISAATVTITVPLIVLVVIFQKRIVAGLTAGALKG